MLHQETGWGKSDLKEHLTGWQGPSKAKSDIS